MDLTRESTTLQLLSRRLRGDDGTALIELALVIPFLFAVTMGILEIGFITKNNLTLTTSLRLATRSDAQTLSFTDRRYADYYALDIFRSTMQELKSAALNRVVVYKPTNGVGAAPANCLTTAPQTGTAGNGVGYANCNIYGKDQLAALTTGTTQVDRFGLSASTASCDSTDWDQFWCPTSRDNTLIGGLDSICVYGEFTYTYITKIIPGTTRTVSDKACTQVEPIS